MAPQEDRNVLELLPVTGPSDLVAGVVLADPTPSDGGGDFTPSTVTPGNGAFFVMFLLAVAVVLLALDMTRRIRRIQAKDRAAARLAAEEEAAAEHAESSVEGGGESGEEMTVPDSEGPDSEGPTGNDGTGTSDKDGLDS
jgi:flagellar biosynthesis/type III secretory pathway M-ring protein FliF/YscJ